MKDISHIRNDLYEYYLEAANEILNGSFKHKLDFVKPELLAKNIACAMLDCAVTTTLTVIGAHTLTVLRK